MWTACKETEREREKLNNDNNEKKKTELESSYSTSERGSGDKSNYCELIISRVYERQQKTRHMRMNNNEKSKRRRKKKWLCAERWEHSWIPILLNKNKKQTEKKKNKTSKQPIDIQPIINMCRVEAVKMPSI